MSYTACKLCVCETILLVTGIIVAIMGMGIDPQTQILINKQQLCVCLGSCLLFIGIIPWVIIGLLELTENERSRYNSYISNIILSKMEVTHD